ncbi:MAG: YncE family protein [Bryobacterales bacterium]|nr:YncE family protein [Bryobacterales bacterium]
MSRLLFVLTLLAVGAACNHSAEGQKTSSPAQGTAGAAPAIPGMPPVLDWKNMYSETAPGKISPAIASHPELVYVPNSAGNTVSVIDPKKMEVIRTFKVGREPQHVVPSWDLKTLYATNDLSNTLSVIDPVTGTFVKTIEVDDPYNMYYTPDGKYAIVVAERMKKLDFRKPDSFELVETVRVPCRGVDHIDFSIDGKYFIATCEFSGELVKVDTVNRKLMGKISTPGGGMPQDIKVSPDGKVFYVADMDAHGVHMIDGDEFKVIGFIPTGKGAHGLYVSRDFKYMYVANRGEGSISLIDLATRKVATKWRIPGGGSPDMGNLSADGKIFWLSGRYHHVVYAIDTTDGKLLAKIKVGRSPHGLCVWPQPGRYSIGHTGIMR